MQNNNNILNSIYGLGFKQKQTILKKYGFNYTKNLDTILNYDNIKKYKFISLIKTDISYNLIKEEIVKKKKRESLLDKIKNGSYKGYKYKMGYPMYGQRIYTNAKTARKRLI